MKRAIITCLGIVLSAVMTLAHASEIKVSSATFAAPEWEGYTNKDGTGLYWEVLKAVYEPEGIRLRLKNMPWARAMKLVTKYRVLDGIVGEYRDTEENLLFPAAPIDVEYLAVIHRKDTDIDWQGRGTLTGKTVSWRRDYDLIPESDIDFTLKEVVRPAKAMALLEIGDIDFFIDEYDEIENMLAAEGLDESEYVIEDLPPGKDVFTGFVNHAKSQQLIDIYNRRIKEMTGNGELEKIYLKWEVDMPSNLQALMAQ
ncbi:substrate-binding periplasmic protein [Kistimonas asteriae]|uniref:substrate-binding periplasmic protein n=1 Tax=Kistimonas asteriae TaxID=517724 RepID=UPI001BA6AC1C|nr:transporter substrate-binding domain-containing protein [Kistimonas asteriae]